MHRRVAPLALTAAVAVWLASPGLPVLPRKTNSPADARVRQWKLPLYFIENRGQADPRVRYYFQGREAAAYFTAGGLTVTLQARFLPAAHDPSAAPGWALKLEFAGGREDVQPEGVGRTPAAVSYFTGPREEWRTGLATYAAVRYRDVWPGIDVVWDGADGRLKSTYVVRPGADPSRIRMAWRGASGIRAGAGGELVVETPAGEFAEQRPAAYQDIGGRRREVAAEYRIEGGAYGFRLGEFDPARELVIDPLVLLYAGYLGGADWDAGFAIAAGADGSAYVTGQTASTQASFPLAAGPYLTQRGSTDAFVAKLSASGAALVYAGYIGGAGADTGYGIAVDPAGNAYITGSTSSTEATFPVTAGPDLTYNGGASDAFVAKLNASGTALVYAGYIGGADSDSGSGIAVDASGNAYVTGAASSSAATFPVTTGPDLTHNGAEDAFVAKLNASGTALLYAGYIGGSGSEQGSGIAVDAYGNAYVTGQTTSSQSTFPVTAGPDLTYNGGASDAFAAKVNAAGTALVYAGYIGGTGSDYAGGIAVDASGNAYLTGRTTSTESTFPVATGPDLTHNGGMDAFVAKVNAAGTGLVYSGYLGGSGDDWGVAIAVDRAGHAYVTGSTTGYAAPADPAFPATGGPDLSFNGTVDAFAAKVSASGAALLYATYLGGAGVDHGYGIAADEAGNAYVTGETDSSEATFPAATGPDLTHNGFSDAFVAKISSALPTAAFRDTAGSVRLLTRYPSPQLFYAGALFAAGPAVAQTAQGDTVAVARDASGSLWANRFTAATQSWGTWQFGAGMTKGTPAIAVGGNGLAYIAVRDNWDAFWLVVYTPGGGFGAWTYLAGVFSEDPVMAACPDGSLYLIGRDNWRSLWSGRFVPATGFQGWRAGGGIIQGKPSLACGSDSVAYLAVRDDWNSLWIARVQGDAWLGWSYGGGIMSGDPQAVAARDGTVYALLRDSGGVLWRRGYREGTADGWLPWASTGGVVQDFGVAGELGEVYAAGRTQANELWWYRLATNQWTYAGFTGIAGGAPAAAPR